MNTRTNELRDDDFQAFAQYAANAAGIMLGENKRQLLVSRLARRVRALGLEDLSDYLHYLQANRDAEHTHFISAITTNLTSFFRERHHFDYLADYLKEQRGGPIGIWSSACSTGEEAYSIAMTVADVGSAPQCSIYASDIDEACVAEAAAGIYRDEDITDLELSKKRRYFLKGAGDKAGKVRVKSELRKKIQFEQRNLMAPWPERQLHVIFCRNVFIYFSEETQTELVRRFASVLVPGGVLFLGHSESPKGTDGLFDTVGRTTYRRLS